jgi:CHAT domain-containing protein/lipopolysaccharide biosynthesis regulator YciM
MAAGRAGLRAALLLLVAWLSAGIHLDLRPPAPPHSTPSQAEDWLASGDYAAAERAARDRIAQLEREDPGNSNARAAARDLLVEALIGAGRAADPLTLSLAESTLDSRKRDSADRAGLAASLHNLGDIHFHRGEYAKAIALHEDGLRTRTELFPSDDPRVADSLERLATTQMRTERYAEALQNLQRAQAIRLKHADQPLLLARTQELIGWLHRYAGDLPAARQPLETARATYRRLAPEHPALVTAIELQGDVLMLQGDVASAARTWKEALALAERLLGDRHPVLSALERRLAYSDNAVGNREEGRRRLERALRIAERVRAECDPELIVLINDSAGSLTVDGEYIEARKLFARSLELSQRCYGPSNSNTATVVFNLAALTTQMGDFTEAEQLYERAIQAWSARGPDDSYVGKGLDALAEVYEISGDLPRARTLFDRALSIRRKIRADHPDVAWTLTNLARVVSASGDVAAALRLVTEASDIYRRNGTSIEPDHMARTVSQRGEIQGRLGNYVMARADFAEAMALRARLFGPDHPITTESRLKVATADFALGRHDQALAAARAARESGLDHVKFTVRHLPERRALAYAARATHGLGLELSLATIAPSARQSDFLDAVIRSRSIVLDELGARVQLFGDTRPEVAAMQDRLNAARQRFANVMLRTMSGEAASPDAAAVLSGARQEREEAEQALAERSAAFRSQLARADVGLSQVLEKLPRDSALVSFVRYERTVVSSGVATRSSRTRAPTTVSMVPSYLAFVVKSGALEPSVVPIGDAARIDSLVTSWRRSLFDDIASGRKDSESLHLTGGELRQQVWDPLVPHLAGTTRVFIVPDGTLNLIPFAALPTEGDRYLVEQSRVIHLLSAERDVVRPEQPPGTAVGLLAIGGPAFSDTSSFATTRSRVPQPGVVTPHIGAVPTQSFRGSSPECLNFESLDFDALPGSRVEAEVIARLWREIGRASSGRDTSQLLTGPLATEHAFKQLSPNRRILHVATHGFFLGDECEPAIAGTRAVGGLIRPNGGGAFSDGARRQSLENPLLLSGLALAGANQRASAKLDEEDGILTAEEVSTLNLEGVEWAVLSACDTGLGTVAAGEGVLGLRRAFQVAGVRTVIMSLWSVEDIAARRWMEALYRARLLNRLDTADSVRQASLTVIRERRLKGESTHPFYWAAFVAAGDWR